MSDSYVLYKKINNSFYEYRKSVIPEVVDNWEDLDGGASFKLWESFVWGSKNRFFKPWWIS